MRKARICWVDLCQDGKIWNANKFKFILSILLDFNLICRKPKFQVCVTVINVKNGSLAFLRNILYLERVNEVATMASTLILYMYMEMNCGTQFYHSERVTLNLFSSIICNLGESWQSRVIIITTCLGRPAGSG